MKKIEKREILLILGIAISASIMIFQIPVSQQEMKYGIFKIFIKW